jgi:RNA polymerase sigma-70 factor (ECF subfamily)
MGVLDGYPLVRGDAAIKKAVAWNVILPDEMAGSDADVIQAVLNGDIDRYAELVDRYQGQALKLAFSMLGNYEDARDASQEAFVSAYRALGRFRGGAKFSTWLYRIVVNECKDVYKRRAHQPLATLQVGEPVPEDDGALFVDVADPTADPSDQLANRELGRLLSRAIGGLAMKQRTAFVLYHIHGLSLEDVAAVMRCRLGTVKSHIFRATEHLRGQLAPWLTKEGI